MFNMRKVSETLPYDLMFHWYHALQDGV